MTPAQLAEEIERLINSAGESLTGTISKIQSKLFSNIAGVLKDLELSEGYIIQSSANRKLLYKAENEFDAVIKNSGYQNAVEKYLTVIPKVDSLNIKYFTSISDAFSPNRNFIKDLQKQVIREVNQIILQDGLTSQIKAPLSNILSQNINSGGSYSGFQEQLRTFIKGSDKAEGRLLKYVRTYTSDILFNYSRAWQQAVTADLKLEYYLYSGGLMDKSRPFCVERAGLFFSHKEVESWAALDWGGKNPLTTKSSIFIFCGGFSCHHSLIPVSQLIVPKEVIDRQKN